MSYRNIHNLKKAVEKILEDVPATRNSDSLLTITLWKKHFPNMILASREGEYIQLERILDLPREDEIGRARRKIQEKKYPPTDEAVARARKFNMDEWRVAMGYPTMATSGSPKPSWTPPSEVKKETEVAVPPQENKLL